MKIPLLAYIIAGLVVLLIAFLVWNHMRQRKLIRKLQDLAHSLEESKALIITEQERNRQLKQEMTNNIEDPGVEYSRIP